MKRKVIILIIIFFAIGYSLNLAYNQYVSYLITPVQISSPTGEIKTDLMPFVYNSLYSIENIVDPQYAISLLKTYPYLVCAEPARLADKELIVTEAIKSEVKIFGYINLGGDPLPDISILKSEIDNIEAANWYGVFIDQFGYDFNETRSRQNEIVDYAHEKGLTCFVNAWFIDDVFGDALDETHNPNGLPSSLSAGDWYLMESFYTSNSGYNSDVDSLISKIESAIAYKEAYGVNIAALSYKRDELDWDESQTDIETSYILASLSGFDAWWYTDHLESDAFIHGKTLDLNFGDVIEHKMSPLDTNHLIVSTDLYDIVLDFYDYPVVEIKYYKSGAKKHLEKLFEMP